MQPYKIFCDNNITAMSAMEANTFDACITDPPYGMDIAGVGWDHNVPPRETWDAVYRVLKPGAFVLSFCAPEFYHRMAVNVEDAGFRPLDMIFWMVTTKMAKTNRLKPAHEPIFVAQKPLDGTIDNKVALWTHQHCERTGALGRQATHGLGQGWQQAQGFWRRRGQGS